MPRSTTRAARSNRDDNDEEVRQGGGPRSRRDLDDAFETGRTEGSSRRSRKDDDDEDEAPRRSVSRRRSRDDEDERPAKRSTTRSRSRDEDSDDDRESRRASRSEGARAATSTSMGKGRESLRKHRETHKSGFPDKLKIDAGEKVLVKFLEDDFFITYYEHWINDFKGEKRQMSFICLGKDCPLCDIGDDPSFYALINVIDLRNPRKPTLAVWYATPNPGGLIEDEIDELEGKKKPQHINDDDKYYVVSKKKSRSGFFEYSLKEVSVDDLEDEYDTEPLDDDEVAEFEDKAYTEDIVRLSTRRDLQDIADELGE